MKTLKERLLGVSTGTATVYRFTFMQTGWAIFTVNDSTGELNIQSDWGDYAYRWNTGALGPNRQGGGRATLTEFLSMCDVGYLVGKLCQSLHHEEKRELNPAATRKGMIKHAAELYRDGGVMWHGGGATLPKEVVKELYAEIRDWIEIASSSIYEAYYFPPELVERYFDDLPEWFVYKDTHRVKFLADELLPIFLEHLRNPKEGADVGA